MFNYDYYLNVKDATIILLSRQVNVEQQLYIGDLNDAIIDNNTYNMVNTKKLLVYDTNKDIKKAYKTSLGTYTDDMLKAKKSMIGDQSVLYSLNIVDLNYQIKRYLIIAICYN